ncbi:MAG: LamG-like jellyroll fold domain-containing protein [Prosthecobacter sp.]
MDKDTDLENDLRDALIAWQDGDLPQERVDELLARLRSDAAFRRALAEEVWTLSLTRVAQAPAPRWLALHEALGLTGAKPDKDNETRRKALLTAVRREPVRFVNVWWQRAAYGSMAAAAALALGLVLWKEPAPDLTKKNLMLAVLVQSDKAQWQGPAAKSFTPGRSLFAERLQLASGRASVMFISGVTMDFEGPADIDLVTADRVVCREGRLRTSVPPGAEGFCVETPRGTVTDLGTELAVSVSSDGKTNVAVFEGQAEVVLQMNGQQGVRTALLNAGESTELVPETGEMQPISRKDFLPAQELRLPALRLAPHYVGAIHEARPIHHWRLDRVKAGVIPNEVPGAPALHLGGGASIEPDEGGRSSARFPGSSAPGALYLDGLLTKPAPAHAIELWFAAETPRLMSLLALTVPETTRRHILLLEVGSRRPGHDLEVGVLRHLMRWPASHRGGMNIYTPGAFPCQWHHLVAQQKNGDLELFIDGQSRGTARSETFPEAVSCALQFGGLEFHAEGDPAKIERPFAGRLAEIAIYDRLLTAKEVRAHAALGRSR